MKFWGIIAGICLSAVQAMAGETLFVSEKEIADAVRREFAEQGVEEQMEMEFFGGQTTFALENAKQVKIMISGLVFDAEQNKFSATAEIFADGKAAAKTSLYGKYYIMQEIKVPAVLIEKGEVIAAENLKTVLMRSNRLKTGVLTEESELVGMQAKRTLKEGKIINDRDVGAQIIIKRGKIVTSVYRSKGLQITAQAEALEDGAKGERIELVNTKSAKKFFAKVIDAETVEIEIE